MIVYPVVGGGGKRFFTDGVCMAVGLVAERPFRNGVLVLRYAVIRRPRDLETGFHERGDRI
jgi:hypothetical protein